MIDPTYSALASHDYGTTSLDTDDYYPNTSTSYSYLNEPSSSSTSRRRKLVSARSMSSGSAGAVRPDLSRPYVDAQGTIHDPEFRTFDVSMAPHALASRQQARASQSGHLSPDSASLFRGAGASLSHYPRSSASSYHTAFRENGPADYSDDDGEEVEEEYARLEREAADEEEEERRRTEELERERERIRYQQLQQQRRAHRHRNASGELDGLVENDGEGEDEELDHFATAGEGYDSDGDVTRLRTTGSPRAGGIGIGGGGIYYAGTSRRRYSRTTDSGYAGTISPSSPPDVIVEQDDDDGVGGVGATRLVPGVDRPMMGGVITPSPSTIPDAASILTGPTHAMRPSPSNSRRSYTTPLIARTTTGLSHNSGNTSPTRTAHHYSQHQPALRELSRSTLYPLPAVNDAFHVPAGSRPALPLTTSLPSPSPSSSSSSSGSSTGAKKRKKKKRRSEGNAVDGIGMGLGIGIGRGLMGLPDGIILPDDADNPFRPVIVDPPPDVHADEEHHHRYHHHLGVVGLRKGKKTKKISEDDDVEESYSTPTRKAYSDPATSTVGTAKKTKTKKKKTKVEKEKTSAELDEKRPHHHLSEAPESTLDAQGDIEKFTGRAHTPTSTPAAYAHAPRTSTKDKDESPSIGINPHPHKPFISIVETSPPRKPSSNATGIEGLRLGTGAGPGDSVRVGGGSVIGVGGSYVPSQHGKTRSLRPGVDVIDDDYA